MMGYNGERIRVVAGDITRLDVDAIVNAANCCCSEAEVWTVPYTGLPEGNCWRNAARSADAGRARAR